MLKTTFSSIFYVLGAATILLIFAVLIAPNFELEKLSYPIPFILAWFVSSVMTKRYVFDHEKMTSYYWIGKRQKKVIYYQDFVSVDISPKIRKIILYTKNDIYKIDSNKVGNYEELTSFINKYIEVERNITEERNIAFNKYYDPIKTIRLQSSWLKTLVIVLFSSLFYRMLFLVILDGSLLKESLGLFIFATIFMSICSLLPSGWLLFGNRYKVDLEKLKIYSLLKVKEVIYFKDIISCGGNESELYFYTKDKKYNITISSDSWATNSNNKAFQAILLKFNPINLEAEKEWQKYHKDSSE